MDFGFMIKASSPFSAETPPSIAIVSEFLRRSSMLMLVLNPLYANFSIVAVVNMHSSVKMMIFPSALAC